MGTLSGDHQPALIKLTAASKPRRAKRWIQDWNGYSKEKLVEELSKEDWNINRGDVQDFCDELDSKIMSVLHKIVPFKFVTSTD